MHSLALHTGTMVPHPITMRGHGRVPHDVDGQLARLLLESMGVDLAMASHPTFVLLSSLKPFFFHSLKNELCFSDSAGAYDLGIQEERKRNQCLPTQACQ